MFREAKIQRMLTQDVVSEADAYYLNKDTSKRGTRGGDGEWKRRNRIQGRTAKTMNHSRVIMEAKNKKKVEAS